MAELRNGASPARTRGPLGRLATCVFLALFGAGVAAGQAGAPAEGPLGNDTFVPVDLTADELLRTGLAELAAAGPGAALETLRAALAASATGAGLNSGTSRLVLGAESAVQRALIAADPKVLAAWLARFEELAEETRRSDPAGAERRFPATRAAVRAALAGADRELADGRPQAARIWLERVTVHLALRAAAGETGTFDATAANAVSARLAAIEGLPGPTAPAVTQTLTGPLDALDTLPAPRTLAFEFQRQDEDPYLADLLGRQDRGGLERGPGLSIRPGLAALGPDRVLVQTGLGLHLLDLNLGARIAVLEPRRLADQAFGRISPPTAARDGGAPGWSHHPLVTDDLVVLVTGRTSSGGTPNALVALERASLAPTTTPTLTQSLEPLPSRARWMLSSNGLVSQGAFTTPALLADLEGAELQPGPVRIDDRLLVQARVLDGEVKAYLICLDLTTGAPLWTRLVAKGGAIDDGLRFGQARLPLGSAAPLAAAGGRVLVSTNLGVDALFDAVDGRLLWTFKTRRVAADDARFSGIRPLVLDPDSGPGTYATPTFVTAPADSDHIYAYRAAPLLGESPLVAPPLPIHSATDLVAHAQRTLFQLAQSGGEHQLVARDLDTGAILDQSILLRRDERFVARPALGAERLVIASNRGVFLFDRTRALYLADHRALPGGAGPRQAGGEVFALGPRLLVLGPGTLWAFEPAE